MPALRTLLAIPLAAALLWLNPAGSPRSAPTTEATLPLLVGEGKAPAAALLATEGAGSRFATTSPALTRADHVRVGSITKTFVATIVLQLVSEKRLSLSAPVTRYLDLPAPADLTVRSLLTQTSGLYDFTDTTHGRYPLTPEATAALALSRPRTTRTPHAYAYSNTNYVLLGMIVRQVTGRPYAAEIRRRVIAPLHLTGTTLPGTRTGVPRPHGPDAVRLDPRTAGAAGEVISTLPDLNRFYRALLGGRLLPPRALATMLNTRTAQGRYGMGMFPEKLSCGITVWGHNGRIADTYVRTAATRSGASVLTYRATTATLSDTTAVERRLLNAEFCPR
ncbi:serine hydrolase [Streptomyces sp. VRA16 Mangrove soil]|uniref:serine hydrolase domain-containing protein n=1 Tax=Streptomyces sp. VRA16 Mangrove soil TaxID=2817434 RepID=UPI001A9D5D8C|nr:serine hydrolase domain-containing protein [Streptomyces sp. VRA16 Mangrove soil]MBO1335099.1 beta-lactamase family protein [Streptomyces sp. VRA16 Mangrove soil]